jgi:hypothetical protein
MVFHLSYFLTQNKIFMANLCGNFLTVTGGTKESLQELSSKFLDLPDEEGFDYIFEDRKSVV